MIGIRLGVGVSSSTGQDLLPASGFSLHQNLEQQGGGTAPSRSRMLPKHQYSLLCLLHGSLTCLFPNSPSLKPSNRRKWSPLALRITMLPHSQAPVLSLASPVLSPNSQSPPVSRLPRPPPPPPWHQCSQRSPRHPGSQMQLRITCVVIKNAVSRDPLLIILELEVCVESTHHVWDQRPQTSEADSPSCFSPTQFIAYQSSSTQT